MKRLSSLSLALTLTLLSGCAARYTPQLMAIDSRACQASGFRQGTVGYNDCMAQAYAFRENRVRQNSQALAAVAVGAAVAGGVAIAANNPGYYPSAPTYRGNCQYEWQYDAAGRRCGKRAASYRPGGY